MHIEICIQQQKLWLKNNDETIRIYSVSTAANGVGELQDSECTPSGDHKIAEMIGHDQAVNTVFVGRRPTGETYSKALRNDQPGRDWILTRIMWLSGCEPGKNQGGNVDSYQRYIYIHGTPDDVEMGQPGSRGCVRMRNKDVIELFSMVSAGTPVSISG